MSRPGRVLRREGSMAEVDVGGRVRWCTALACPEVRAGDRVLTHANLVLSVLSAPEAGEAERLIDRLEGGHDAG